MPKQPPASHYMEPCRHLHQLQQSRQPKLHFWWTSMQPPALHCMGPCKRLRRVRNLKATKLPLVSQDEVSSIVLHCKEPCNYVDRLQPGKKPQCPSHGIMLTYHERASSIALRCMEPCTHLHQLRWAESPTVTPLTAMLSLMLVYHNTASNVALQTVLWDTGRAARAVTASAPSWQRSSSRTTMLEDDPSWRWSGRKSLDSVGPGPAEPMGLADGGSRSASRALRAAQTWAHRRAQVAAHDAQGSRSIEHEVEAFRALATSAGATRPHRRAQEDAHESRVTQHEVVALKALATPEVVCQAHMRVQVRAYDA